MTHLWSAFTDLLGLIWRLTWLILGLGMVVGLLTLGVLAWLFARFTGRQPPAVRAKWPGKGAPSFGFRHRPQPPTDDTVVDVQAREVPPQTDALSGPDRPR